MNNTTDDNDGSMSCANCGKEGSNLNTCNRCNLVKYCNAACKKKHRSKHKKKCDRRVAELHDEALFKQQPPQAEDECPICFIRVPTLQTGMRYNTCCGKVICSGCIHAGGMANADQLCPFCRTPAPYTEEEAIKRVKKRVEVGDAQAMYELGYYYSEGMYGMPQDFPKSLELWHQAAELGHADSYHNIGNAYLYGHAVERDGKKAKHCWELAAMGGHEYARHNLGVYEHDAGNIERALNHFMIAVGSGHHGSLEMIKQLYSDGLATRDDYANALKAYQDYLEEIKSDDRDKAAAYREDYKYYE